MIKEFAKDFGVGVAAMVCACLFFWGLSSLGEWLSKISLPQAVGVVGAIVGILIFTYGTGRFLRGK